MIKLTPTGHVEIHRRIQGASWRRAISPHSIAELDEYGPPDLTPELRDEILERWAGIPVPPPPPPPTPVVIPDALKDTPASVNSVPALRAEINALKAHLRGD